MPNTKSAERRARVSVRRQARNTATKSRLKTLEKKYRTAAQGGNKDDATKAFQAAISAVDKAAKLGVIPKGRADRKKSRLALKLNKVGVAAAAPAVA